MGTNNFHDIVSIVSLFHIPVFWDFLHWDSRKHALLISMYQVTSNNSQTQRSSVCKSGPLAIPFSRCVSCWGHCRKSGFGHSLLHPHWHCLRHPTWKHHTISHHKSKQCYTISYFHLHPNGINATTIGIRLMKMLLHASFRSLVIFIGNLKSWQGQASEPPKRRPATVIKKTLTLPSYHLRHWRCQQDAWVLVAPARSCVSERKLH